jgi:hypothetical protein
MLTEWFNISGGLRRAESPSVQTFLREGGTIVPGFVSGGSQLIPHNARGTVSHKLFHVTDWLPTLRATLQLDATGACPDPTLSYSVSES